MNLEELLNLVYKKTNDLNKRHSLKWLLATMLNMSFSDFYINMDMKVDINFKNKYLKLVNKHLNDNIPVQYLVNKAFFYNNEFYINEHVLIPRAETEELVFKTINYINNHFKNKDTINILDLGTGSGIIGITLKQQIKNANVTVSDYSLDALKVSRKNINKFNLNIKTIHSNWLNNIKDKYDVIISNPPYIKDSYKLESHVLKEPKMALFSGKEGLDSYESILKDINKNLNDKFLICFEHGYDQKDKLNILINKYLNNVSILSERDLNKKDRYTFIFNK